MLLAKYRRMEELRLEAYLLGEIHNQIPLHILIEIEGKRTTSKVRTELYQKGIKEYRTKILTIQELVDFNTDLKQTIHRFNLSKTKFYKLVADGVYYEQVMFAIRNKHKQLPPTSSAFFGKNLIFKCFPKFGRITS